MTNELDALLAEQVAYYRAVAGEYEDHSIPLAWSRMGACCSWTTATGRRTS